MAAPAPAAAAAALLAWFCCCSRTDRGGEGGGCARSTGWARAPEAKARQSASVARDLMPRLPQHSSGDGVDLVQLADVEKVVLERLHFGPHLSDDRGLEVVEVDLRPAPVELGKLAHHRLRRQV